ncbi:outer membrane beta-barrel protein [Pontibacter liquoris]|uniref:outer membrane beta-barrel protein n=1 Tax=Pontibacter liquoris TaxID=2905677 RepID=UPI001FA78A55|nr:outer membrane beta-barrel protein [Pontibacter liquoris]
MKKLILPLLLFLLSGSVLAQKTDAARAAKHKFYAGIGLTSVPYHIYYKNPKTSGYLPSDYFVPFAANLGYRLTEKATLQGGVAYGGDKDQGSWLPDGQDTLAYEMASRTRVVAVPVTARINILKLYKRFPVYVTGTLMPAYGVTTLKTTQTSHAATTTHRVKDAGMDVFSTAGFGITYRISNCMQGYAEVLPFKYNLTGENSRDLDWERYASQARQLYKSLGFWVNYTL